MKTKFSAVFFLATALLFSSYLTTSALGSDYAAERINGLRSHLNTISSLKFHFNQNTSGQLSGRPRKASGEAYLLQSGEKAQMRWDYLAPDIQVIINDGETLTMYFEKLNQMIIGPSENLQQDVIYLFFTGKSDITEHFSIEQRISEQDLATDSGDRIEIFKLMPKDSHNILSLTLWITASNHIMRIEILDSFDTRTQISMSDIEENTIRDTSATTLFQFTPPEGTEIIKQ